jgi:deoxyhypusine synthase
LNKKEILSDVLRHVDVKAFDARPLIQAYGDMAFQARNLSRATGILNQMLADRECASS